MDIVDKLLAACVGYPVTNIPWPHRVLHDAVEEITRLRDELAKCRELLRRAYGYTTAAADLLPEEIKDALAAKGE